MRSASQEATERHLVVVEVAVRRVAIAEERMVMLEERMLRAEERAAKAEKMLAIAEAALGKRGQENEVTGSGYRPSTKCCGYGSRRVGDFTWVVQNACERSAAEGVNAAMGRGQPR
jgi:hypothetical protein